MTVSVDDFNKNFSEIYQMVNKLPEHIKRLEKEIALCDQETQDILHKIELHNFNAHQGWELAKDLKLTRLSRRRAKDELKGLTDIYERLNRNSKFIVHTEASLRDIDKHKKTLCNRKYKPRVRTDWNDYFEVEDNK